MIDRKDWPEDARNAQAAFDEASWNAWQNGGCFFKYRTVKIGVDLVSFAMI